LRREEFSVSSSEATVPLSALLLTPALTQRPSRSPDFAAETRALQLLAQEMPNTPQHFLQCLVTMARELCQAGSAGVSYLEHNRAGDHFRWIALDGMLRPYRTRTIPYQDSPCGSCLDHHTFELFASPGRSYAEFRAVDPPIVEVLILPVYVEERPLGTLWVASHEEQRHFESEDLRLLQSLSAFAAMALQVQEARDTALTLNTHLQAAHAHTTQILESITDAFCTLDRQWRFTYVNPQAKKLWGRPHEDFIGKTVWEEFPEVARLIFGQQLRTAMAERVTVDFEGRYPPLGVWLALRAYPTPEGMAVYFQDITARKQAERAVRESEEKYRALFDSIDEGFCVIEVLYDAHDTPLDYRFLAVNPAFVQQTGITDAVGKRMRDIAPQHEDEWFTIYSHVALTGESRRFEYQAAQLHHFYDVYAFRIGKPAARTVAILFNDITERKRLEAALQQERDLLQVTLTSIGDAVIVTDTTALVTFLNPVAETLTGWPAQEARGRPLSEVFQILNAQTRQPGTNLVEQAIRDRGTIELANHIALLARDGRETLIANSGAPICDPDGHRYGAVLVFRDITDSKHAEAALLHAKAAAEEADRIKSEFVATMSHELRTPLNVILGYTDMLLDGAVGDLPPPQVDILRRIDHNSRVLFELISMVLDLNRLEAGRLPVDVQEVHIPDFLAQLKAEMQGLCDQSGLTCLWSVAPGLPVIHTDAGKLKVILKNLLGNAVKFNSEGSITVAALERQGGIEFDVIDTGIGIPAEAQAAIFEPFRQLDGSNTRRYSGSGLGLHIVQRLLELLDGRITVESEVKRGSTFRVWLPLRRDTSTPAASSERSNTKLF
jgi:PAS domain S-box-containing protein